MRTTDLQIAMNEPTHEEQRQRSLDKLKAVDTPPDPLYDDIVRIAASICDAPIALVSLVDRDRQWFKANLGLPATETPRSVAVCDHAIREPGKVFQVADLAKDSRFASFPYVQDGTARFYAGMPLVTSDGSAVGTVCVMDREPRRLSEDQARSMQALSRVTMALMEADCRRHYEKIAETLSKDPQAAVAADDAEGYRVAIARVRRYADEVSQRGERTMEKLFGEVIGKLDQRIDQRAGDYIDRVTGSPEIVVVLRGDETMERAQRLLAVAEASIAGTGIGFDLGSAEAARPDEPLIAVYLRADENLSQRSAGQAD